MIEIMQQTPSSREIPALTSISPSFHSHPVNKPGLMTLCHLAPALAVLPLLGDALRWQPGCLQVFTLCSTLRFRSSGPQWEISTDGSTLRRSRGMLSFLYVGKRRRADASPGDLRP